MKPNRAKPGIMLVEIVIALCLISIAMLLEVRLFRSTMNVMNATSAEQNAQAKFEHRISALRTAVWNAAAIDVPDPHTVVLTQSDGTKTQHTIEPPLTAESSGSLLVLRFAGGSRRFVSQVLAAKGAQQ